MNRFVRFVIIAGSLPTLVCVVPRLLGMALFLMALDVGSASTETTVFGVELAVGTLFCLVPTSLAGIVLAALIEVAVAVDGGQ